MGKKVKYRDWRVAHAKDMQLLIINKNGDNYKIKIVDNIGYQLSDYEVCNYLYLLLGELKYEYSYNILKLFVDSTYDIYQALRRVYISKFIKSFDIIKIGG